MEMFYNRPVKGHLPNRFVKEHTIRKLVEKRITNQFKSALKKGRYNRDEFIEGNKVRVHSPKGTCDIHGEVVARRSTENGDRGLY